MAQLHRRRDESNGRRSPSLGQARCCACNGLGWNDASLKAGVDSIEHGMALTKDSWTGWCGRVVYWCPTIYVGVYVAEGRAAGGAPIWLTMRRPRSQSLRPGGPQRRKIAYGTDAARLSWTENQAKELPTWCAMEMTALQAIQSATVVAADLLERSSDFGAIEPGKFCRHYRGDRRSLARY